MKDVEPTFQQCNSDCIRKIMDGIHEHIDILILDAFNSRNHFENRKPRWLNVAIITITEGPNS